MWWPPGQGRTVGRRRAERRRGVSSLFIDLGDSDIAEVSTFGVMHLLVMAKEPIAGQVKTRLTPACSPTEAALLAEAALADTLEAACASGADEVIVALDGRAGPWCPTGVRIVQQITGSFDLRLAAAWSAVGGPGLQIGMDTPQVTADLLDESLDLLVRHDAVLGLALDGGWWAIGQRRPHPSVFDGVPMSRDDTGALQLERMRLFGLDVALLSELRDVDRIDDVSAVAAEIPGSRFARTWRAISVASSPVASSPVASSPVMAESRVGAR